jgi:hypothetical protein
MLYSPQRFRQVSVPIAKKSKIWLGASLFLTKEARDDSENAHANAVQRLQITIPEEVEK